MAVKPTLNQLKIKRHMGSVCLVTSHRYGEAIGGIETFVGSFSRWLLGKGVKTTIITRKFSFLNLSSTNSNEKPSRSLTYRRIKTMQVPYVIYVVYMLFYSFVTALFIMKLNKKHRFSVIHSQDNFASFSAVLVKKLMRIRVIGHSHGPEIYHIESFILRLISLALDKYIAKRVNQMLVTDDVTYNYFVSLTVPSSNIMTVPTGIEFLSFQQTEDICTARIQSKAERQTKFNLGYVGRLSREKNIRTLVRAFSQIVSEKSANFRLVLVGDGPEKATIKALVRKRKLEKSVFFAGWRTDIRELLCTFDIFVLPSLIEGCPIALLEAMATGRAIIASNISSVREITRNGEEAILVNPYDVQELKHAILLLSTDSGLRVKLGRKARERAKLYDVDRVYSRILETYEEHSR